jgi:mono/diheme cytochrome c family protein
MTGKIILTLTLIAAAVLAPASRSVWDGVYTDAQAKRGEALFAENCVTCHGPGLEGDGEAPPLSGGEPFWAWNGKPLTALFDKIHKEMPHNKPGTLSPEASADLLAYVLQFDKFPAGASELPHDSAAMNQIRYESEEVRLEEIRASQPACRVTNQTTSPSNSRSTR